MKENEESLLREVVTEDINACNGEPKVVKAHLMAETEDRHSQKSFYSNRDIAVRKEKVS